MADNDKPAAAATTTKSETNQRVEHGRAKARDNARSEAERKLDAENEARHNANIEAEERRNSMQPTPTQRENDLAKLGHDVSEKEDDGSGPEQAIEGRRGGSYNTRDLSK